MSAIVRKMKVQSRNNNNNSSSSIANNKKPAFLNDNSDSSDDADDDKDIVIIERKMKNSLLATVSAPASTTATTTKKTKATKAKTTDNTNTLKSSKSLNKTTPKSKEISQENYHKQFNNKVGQERAIKVLKDWENLKTNPNSLGKKDLDDAKDKFLISINTTYPGLSSRCFQTVFKIGSSRYEKFIKKNGERSRSKPGGTTVEKVISEETKVVLRNYVGSVDKLKFKSIKELFDNYKSHCDSHHSGVKRITSYKTFYEHFKKEFPNIIFTNKVPDDDADDDSEDDTFTQITSKRMKK